VQEAFTLESSYGLGITDYFPPHHDGRPTNQVGGGDVDHGSWWEQPWYRATDEEPELIVEGMDEPGCRWSSSAQMPRWASRLLLQITDVKAERIQAITEVGAMDEGYGDTVAEGLAQVVNAAALLYGRTYRGRFADAWDQINKNNKNAVAWQDNPVVWVIGFEVLENKTAPRYKAGIDC
jgi:hypothetical protein